MPPAEMQVFFTVGMLPLAVMALVSAGGRIEADRRGITCGIANGVFAGLGGLAYFAAMRSGQASVVGPVTSLFPLVTVILGLVVLKERLNRVQVAGVVLGAVAVAVLSA